MLIPGGSGKSITVITVFKVALAAPDRAVVIEILYNRLAGNCF